MKNPVVGRYEAEDLQKQVEKVLRGLGNPEPPIDLREVRELLRLDKGYFSSKDDSYLRETVSKVKIAGKQIIERPTLLLDVVRKAKLSALWLPDSRRILLDQDEPILKHRWSEAHEIGHSIAEWHGLFMFGDDAETLNRACHEKLEGEANFAAGQLLFMQKRFTAEANDLPVSIATVKSLNKKFGNTLTSTLWRFIEESHSDQPMVGIVSQHPHRTDEKFDPASPCRYFIESPKFREKFSSANEVEIFGMIKKYSRNAKGGPLGASEVIISDNNGDRHVFKFETFCNHHDALTIGVYVRPATLLRSFA
jgi:hypothetical protein